ncbi:UDP-N-acetylmuramoyl-tripeptide--D-alanyl-D-alanine ligase [Poseidonocella sedimentorum]|uniref:UDP-N-acetylmuramoyl-tripeptide--D-alanyl-D-alanine ligase n=1 Tax=Poseidonocella sedimentorum TaxID=871652 RepID=A0A1I6E560_9RHOB|nr:UDP-N-acetylmuramoyl-tripeptide--D-alanyl-D-alanine ligase [Poseidonocella sedimentorum]SFR12846.1 UDP-N-acetylmuramoyl-tripeptide--D-alanyl-D-alanine ligase [Poseidonocella sedimentorum]
MMLWTSQEAVAATGGTCATDWTATGVSIDTRTLQPGDLFIALKAARDGHDFVAAALEKGAAAALVSHIPDDVAPDAPLLVVKDVFAGLEDLGRAARARTGAQVIAVTGSAGKTSTKEMLRRVLAGRGRTHCAEASYNNHWGVPLTLARMPAATEFAVIEIGMNHPGEIAPLSRIARPHIGIVTTVAPAHIEAFNDLAGIAREKSAIFDGLEPGGTAIFNGDLGVSDILRAGAEARAETVLDFGNGESAAYRAREITLGPDGTEVTAQTPTGAARYGIGAPGRHFALNALAVLATIDTLGLDRAQAVADLGHWRPYKGRGTRERIVLHKGAGAGSAPAAIDLFDDSYNANPASLGAALAVLAQAHGADHMGRIDRGRRIAILGDMKELGIRATGLHEEIAQLDAIASVDLVHTVGPLMRHLHDALPAQKRGLAVDTASEMARMIPAVLDAGDVVLIKGSLSMGLAEVVDAVRKLGHPASHSKSEDA